MNSNSLMTYASTFIHSYLEAVADACVLYARSSSTFHVLIENGDSLPPVAHSCIETTYYLAIFLFRFLAIELTSHNHQPLQRLVIYTLVQMLKIIAESSVPIEAYESLEWLLPICALDSVCFSYVVIFQRRLLTNLTVFP